MFSASFTLAPLLVLIINLIDLRLDAQRLLWLYRRPVGYKAQDIGIVQHNLNSSLLIVSLYLFQKARGLKYVGS